MENDDLVRDGMFEHEEFCMNDNRHRFMEHDYQNVFAAHRNHTRQKNRETQRYT